MTTKFVVSHELKLKLHFIDPQLRQYQAYLPGEVHFRDKALAGLKLPKIIRYFSAPQ